MLRMVRFIIRQCKLMVCHFFYDISYMVKNREKIVSKIRNNDVNTIFICDINFFIKNKWQVASQSKLWHKFVEDNDLLLCGSSLSYFIYGRYFKNIVSLEVYYNAPKINFLSHHDRIVMFISDSHSKKWLPKHIKNANITDILTPYKKTLQYTGFCGDLDTENIHSFPWCVTTEDMRDVHIKSNNNNVLSFGKIGSEVYDLREWAFNTGELVAYDYAGSGNKKYSGNAFYQWLRSFDACVVAMSSMKIYNYTVAKYFEVPSQGLLLFAFPSDDFSELGFIDNYNCIYVNKDNFYDKINEFKNSPEKYIEIRKNGFDFIRNNHTDLCRIDYLNKIIN